MNPLPTESAVTKSRLGHDSEMAVVTFQTAWSSFRRRLSALEGFRSAPERAAGCEIHACRRCDLPSQLRNWCSHLSIQGSIEPAALAERASAARSRWRQPRQG